MCSLTGRNFKAIVRIIVGGVDSPVYDLPPCYYIKAEYIRRLAKNAEDFHARNIYCAHPSIDSHER